MRVFKNFLKVIVVISGALNLKKNSTLTYEKKNNALTTQ